MVIATHSDLEWDSYGQFTRLLHILFIVWHWDYSGFLNHPHNLSLLSLLYGPGPNNTWVIEHRWTRAGNLFFLILTNCFIQCVWGKKHTLTANSSIQNQALLVRGRWPKVSLLMLHGVSERSMMKSIIENLGERGPRPPDWWHWPRVRLYMPNTQSVPLIFVQVHHDGHLSLGSEGWM